MPSPSPGPEAGQGEPSTVLEALQRGRKDALTLAGRGCGVAASAHLVRALDEGIRAIYELGRACHPESGPICVLATGGYGRGELSPFSDVDLAVVPADGRDTEELVKSLYHLVFDILGGAGLTVTYTYRPLEDLPRLDHVTVTALLECRLVAGDPALYQHFEEELHGIVDALAFVLEKIGERKRQGMNRADTIYLVEPNVKEGPGGLRDAQSALWISRGIFGLRGSDPLQQLADLGHLEKDEGERVRAALRFLMDVRYCLHLAAGRKNDLLLVAQQEAVAGRLGYPDAESLMREYYASAAIVHRFSERLSQHCLNQTLDLGDGFAVVAGKLCVSSEEEFLSNPERCLLAFRLAKKYSLPLALELQTLVEQNAPRIDEHIRHSPLAGQYFLALFDSCSGLADTLREMLRLGVLHSFLPEFTALEGLIPYDPSHVFTVGEHSLQLLEQLENLSLPSATEQGRFRPILERLKDPALLLLACLFHDMGKASRRESHAEEGARMTRPILDRLGLSKERSEKVCFLIQNHLTLARTSRLRDLNIDRTITEVAELVGDTETLDLLYLLTYVDTKCVGPGSLSAVAERSLDELYGKVLRKTLSELPEQDVLTRVEDVIENIVRQVTLRDVSDEAVRQHCRQMPPSYVLNAEVGEIAMHIVFARRLAQENPLIHFFDPAGGSLTEVTVCTYEEPSPGLFSKITGAFFASGINIHQAQVFTRSSRPEVAIDTFWVDFNGTQLEERHKERLQVAIREVLAGNITVDRLLHSRGKPPPESISLDMLKLNNQVSDDHTVVEIRAADQAGLLYVTATALSKLGLDIGTAKITTWAGKAENAFYVTDDQGRKVDDERSAGLEERLARILKGEA